MVELGEPLSKTLKLKSGMKTSYSGFLIPKEQNTATNKTFYSFGGKKTFKDARNEHEMVAPTLLPNQIVYTKRVCDDIIQHQIQRVNDYTKNISESIFSPGLITHEDRKLRSASNHGGRRSA